MTGWIIATIVLSCYLLFSLIVIIGIGIYSKWAGELYLYYLCFVLLFPIFLPFAIYNWSHGTKNEKSSQQSSENLLSNVATDRFEEGYKKGYEEGYDKGYEEGYGEGLIDNDGEE